MENQAQLTEKPLCPVCMHEELTDEELAKAKETGNRRCWYCMVEAAVQAGMNIAWIPEPAEWGRPSESKEGGIERAKTKTFRSMSPQEAIKEMIKGALPPDPSGEAVKPVKKVLQMPVGQASLSEEERKEFIVKHGIDPSPKIQPYEIVVHGAGDDTYMKFVCPIPSIDLAEEREIKRIMGGMLDIFGKLLKYGPQFAGTLIELKNISPEMFLGRQ